MTRGRARGRSGRACKARAILCRTAAVAQSNRHIGDVARDPLWLPHRYDPGHDAVHFRRTPRAVHRAATFITDEYLPADAGTGDRCAAPTRWPPAGHRRRSISFSIPAYCCSTLLARAVDIEGVAMGLKEPVILNDLVGWRQRGGEPRRGRARCSTVR